MAASSLTTCPASAAPSPNATRVSTPPASSWRSSTCRTSTTSTATSSRRCVYFWLFLVILGYFCIGNWCDVVFFSYNRICSSTTKATSKLPTSASLNDCCRVKRRTPCAAPRSTCPQSCTGSPGTTKRSIGGRSVSSSTRWWSELRRFIHRYVSFCFRTGNWSDGKVFSFTARRLHGSDASHLGG